MLQKLKLQTGLTHRIISLAAALTLVFAFGLNQIIYAATYTEADVTLSDSRPSDDPTGGGTGVSYDFEASSVTNTNIQCVSFEFDTQADGAGGLPTGMDITGATLNNGSSDFFATPTSWTAADTGNIVEVTFATGESPGVTTDANIVLDGITNGTVEDTSYYLLVNSYDNTNCSTSPVDSVTVQFIFTFGSTVSLSVDPAFTFTVNAVDHTLTEYVDEDDTSSEATTVTTTATTVPFGQVTTGGNEVAAQDLTISTNAQNGYNVYLRQTAALTNGTSDTIDAVSVPQGTNCTYAAPQPFTAASNEAFGFTTDDADISSGNYQDGAGNNDWCDVTGSDQAVAANTTPTSGTETTRIGYQAGISPTTEAGTYSNTIIYTAVPTY